METNINTPNMFLILPLEVASDENISATSKLLFGYILGLTHNKEGKCYASDEYLSNSVNVSRVSIQRLLKELEDATYISREVVYKENSKEIAFRYISVNIKVGNLKNKNTGILKNKNTGILKNKVDNNKDLNNKDHYLSDNEAEPQTNKYLDNNNISLDNKSLDDNDNSLAEEDNKYLESNTRLLNKHFEFIDRNFISEEVKQTIKEWLSNCYSKKPSITFTPKMLKRELDDLTSSCKTKEELLQVVIDTSRSQWNTFKYILDKKKSPARNNNYSNTNQPRVTEQKRPGTFVAL